MKYLIILLSVLFALEMVSCDKVSNPYPPTYPTDLNTSYYPGNWNDYVDNEWPDFTTIDNADPNRNVLLEDYTGHNCSSCPAAGEVAHNLHSGNPSRIFIASIHASPFGMSNFQSVNIGLGYPVDFTNANGLDLGEFFGSYDGSFFGNPGGTINRKANSGYIFSSSGSWSTKSNVVLTSPLQVAVKGVVNYYPETKGAFLHTEVEVLDEALTEELAMVVYLIEDSLVAPQNVDGTRDPMYVHRDILRGCLSGDKFGRNLTPGLMKDGKYYLDYSFAVPNQLSSTGAEGSHNAENMHLLIYVYKRSNYEILQVIKKKFV